MRGRTVRHAGRCGPSPITLRRHAVSALRLFDENNGRNLRLPRSYRSVPQRIITICRDAVEEKQILPYYIARIVMARSFNRTEKGVTRLMPGLTGNGQRRHRIAMVH